MTNIRQSYFLVFIGIASTVYIAQQFSFSIPQLINNYLNDLLCMPIVLKICQYAVRFIKKDEHITIPIKISFVLTILYALYFELLLPKLNDRYTADFMDVVLYFIGFVFFLWIENTLKENHKTLS
ncbi:unnamed protein product [Ectocarpus sp. 12 AP-2014]